MRRPGRRLKVALLQRPARPFEDEEPALYKSIEALRRGYSTGERRVQNLIQLAKDELARVGTRPQTPPSVRAALNS